MDGLHGLDCPDDSDGSDGIFPDFTRVKPSTVRYGGLLRLPVRNGA